MLEFQKNQTKKETNSTTQTIGEEWKKYNKRMDDMIDDAEIEAEMEAEKKIRSKNSRLFTISIISISLLILIFIILKLLFSKLYNAPRMLQWRLCCILDFTIIRLQIIFKIYRYNSHDIYYLSSNFAK